MINIGKVDIFGWESAIRGMRNPMNSWAKSDSMWDKDGDYCIGMNDLKLMKSLSKAGSDHAKFLRMINVTCDIIAPLYWWKEFDTYKVGTVANSCSTMHKIHEKEFTLADFSGEKLLDVNDIPEHYMQIKMGEFVSFFGGKELLSEFIIPMLNYYRELFLKTKDKKYWWQMIQLLPSSYNQRRTVQLNYQVLKSMYFARKNHKLDEWVDFCGWVERLPYFKEICI